MLKFVIMYFMSLTVLIIANPAQSNAQTAKDYLKSGNQKFYAQQYVAAMADFKKAIALEPTYSKAYQNLGNVMYLLQDFDGALNNFSKAIKYDSRSSEAYISRGTLYLALRKYKDAQSDIEKALEINPKHPIAIELNGSVQFMLGEKEVACESWQEAAKMGNEIARKKLAKHCGIELPAPVVASNSPLLRGGKPDEEKGKKDKLPNTAEELIELADHQMELRNYDKALDLFNKAIKKDSKSCKAYFGRGTAKFAKHDQKGACKDWNKAVELGCEEAVEFIEHGCHD